VAKASSPPDCAEGVAGVAGSAAVAGSAGVAAVPLDGSAGVAGVAPCEGVAGVAGVALWGALWPESGWLAAAAPAPSARAALAAISFSIIILHPFRYAPEVRRHQPLTKEGVPRCCAVIGELLAAGG